MVWGAENEVLLTKSGERHPWAPSGTPHSANTPNNVDQSGPLKVKGRIGRRNGGRGGGADGAWGAGGLELEISFSIPFLNERWQ